MKYTCTIDGCDRPVKTCTKCGESKSLTEFHRRTNRKSGYSSACKTCCLAQKKAHYDKHRSKFVERNRAQYQANRERRLAYQKAYNEANVEQRRAYGRARYVEKWSTDPAFRERYYAATIRRKQLLGSSSQEPYRRDDIFERDGWTCGICATLIDRQVKWPDCGSASIDHIVPLSLGGDDIPSNVQAAHLGCNLSKGNRID